MGLRLMLEVGEKRNQMGWEFAQTSVFFFGIDKVTVGTLISGRNKTDMKEEEARVERHISAKR